MRIIASLITATLMSAPVAAQPSRPYEGLQTREVKALSPEQIADLRASRGMGLALAAELNGYPGPAHVLELAGPLALTAEQETRTRALHEAMKREAAALGEQLIADEVRLDRAFATGTITPTALAAATQAIGRTQAELRAAHLRYHLEQRALLTPEQTQRYAVLRGYADQSATPHQHQHHHH